MPNLREQYFREDLMGEAVSLISERNQVLLSEALGIYLETPEIEERIKTDPYDVVSGESYISDLLSSLSL